MDDKQHAERPDLWLTETTTPGLVMQTDVNSGEKEALFAGAAAHGNDQGEVNRADTSYQLRRYDPQHIDGYAHEGSDDLPYLLRACQEANKRSVQADGFEQWWITDSAGKIIYPLETRPRVHTSPAAELNEVLQPFRDIQAITNAPALHDFLFLTHAGDEAERQKRLKLLVQELEITAAHIRSLVE